MKNLLLFSTLLLTSVGAFAQLTVKPNGATDSYVYVKDQILYVDGAINLAMNSVGGNQEASIYLRNDSQLIQGGIASTNTGNGYLSVQQNTKPTNAFAYYYWCSPVGNPVNVGEIGGTALPMGNQNFGLSNIYEDKNTDIGEGTKAAISANIAAKEGYSSPLTISRRWMYIHPDPSTEAEDTYIRINASNGAPAGFGFTMKGVNTGDATTNTATTTLDQTYEFRGRPNNGDFEIPVAGPVYTGSGPTAVDAMMTLTGNPYPSALDLNQVFWEPGNEELNAIFYYDEDRTVMSHLYSQKPFGYGVWVPGDQDTGSDKSTNTPPGSYVQATFFIWKADGSHGGTGTPSTRTANNKRYAPIGQGFMFVGGDTGTDDLVTIKNSHRIFKKEGGGSIFFRPTGDESSDNDTTTQEDPTSNRAATADENIDTRTPQLRLYVVFDDALTRDMLLLFSRKTTDGYDRGWDGLSPGGMASDAFFPIGDDSAKLPYVIQGTNFNVDKQIPITFKLKKAGKIEVRAVEEINKPYRTAYLFDNVENTYRVLAKAGSATSSFTLPAGTFENRFFIVFRNPNVKRDTPEEEALAQEEVMKNVDFFQNNPAQQLEVRNPNGYTIKSAAVYDMTGKLVINEQNLGDDTKFTFYTGNLAEGVYLVKLLTSEDITIDYKTIVRNK